MLVLALDTSTPACGVAVVELDAAGEPTVRASRSVVDARKHGELLAPMVRAALADAGSRPAELAAVVVGTGPGPFTSLRVGMVTAAALADALRLPVFGVCSLDGIGAATDGSVGVVTDARRREVFWARYLDGKRVGEPGVGRPADVAGQLAAAGVRQVVGPGVALYPDVFGASSSTGAAAPAATSSTGSSSTGSSAGTAVPAGTAGSGAAGPGPVPDHPSPAVLVRVAAADILAGRQPAPLVPLYLRRPDAAEPHPPKPVTA